MSTFIRFTCESLVTDSLTVCESENELSVNFWSGNKLQTEIKLTKEDCKTLIYELNNIYNQLK